MMMMKPRARGARVRVVMSRRRVRARRGSIEIEIKTAFRAERLEPLRDALEPRGARDVLLD